jgi:hypothetical protein
VSQQEIRWWIGPAVARGGGKHGNSVDAVVLLLLVGMLIICLLPVALSFAGIAAAQGTCSLQRYIHASPMNGF